jgi:ubiquinone/menaquinone biosynthesis C-methylase UbiE
MFSEPQKVLSQIHIDPAMSIADFGCGIGHYSIPLAEIVGPSGNVFSFDIQKELLARLNTEAKQKNLDNIHTHWTDLDEPNSTSLKPQTIDRVFMVNVLFQTEDKKSLIREAKRILKSNGKVVVIDWSDSFGGLGPRPTSILKSETAKELFVEENFIIENDINAGEHHYGFVAKVKLV